MKAEVWINKKNKQPYWFLGKVKDCTNNTKDSGKEMVLYGRHGRLYTRDPLEFLEKFEYSETKKIETLNTYLSVEE